MLPRAILMSILDCTDENFLIGISIRLYIFFTFFQFSRNGNSTESAEKFANPACQHIYICQDTSIVFTKIKLFAVKMQRKEQCTKPYFRNLSISFKMQTTQ